MTRIALALVSISLLCGTAQAASRSVSLTGIRNASAKLQRVVNKTQVDAHGWRSVESDALTASIQKAKLSPAGRRALRTAYTAAYPSGTEFRTDPSKADINRALKNAVARLAKADNGNKIITAKEAKATKFWTPRTLFSYAVSLKK